MAGSKAIDFYALSRGVPRKPARNLIETAQRKSQDLAKDFVQLSNVALAANGITKFCLDHGESGFHIRADTVGQPSR